MDKEQYKAHCQTRMANALPKTKECKDFLVDPGTDYRYPQLRARKLKGAAK